MKYFLLRSAFISFENILRSSVNYWVLIGLLSDNVWFLIPKNAKTFQKSGFNIFRVQRSSFSVYFNNLIKSAEYNLPKKSKQLTFVHEIMTTWTLNVFSRLSTSKPSSSINFINQIFDPTRFCFIFSLFKTISYCVNEDY